MEQQTVSVAKAGIVASLNARAAVLASANPVGSRYDPALSVVDNIALPPSLVSRFDLIYLLLDAADEAADRTLARHLIALHGPSPPAAPAGSIPAPLLRDYIAHARATCHPVIGDEAGRALVDAYVALREAGASRRTVAATPRQLESLIRLSEALARMRLAPAVSLDDVAEACRLVRVALRQAATDPATGALDVDLLTTGVSAAGRAAAAAMGQEMLKALRAGPAAGQTVGELLAALRAAGAAPAAAGPAQVREAARVLGPAVDVTGDVVRLA
jgi:DNA replication licensing factor MCM4